MLYVSGIALFTFKTASFGENLSTSHRNLAWSHTGHISRSLFLTVLINCFIGFKVSGSQFSYLSLLRSLEWCIEISTQSSSCRKKFSNGRKYLPCKVIFIFRIHLLVRNMLLVVSFWITLAFMVSIWKKRIVVRQRIKSNHSIIKGNSLVGKGTQICVCSCAEARKYIANHSCRVISHCPLNYFPSKHFCFTNINSPVCPSGRASAAVFYIDLV